MSNQNPEPIVLSASIELQPGESTGNVQLQHAMGAPQEMSIFAVYCYIYPGYTAIGADTDYPNGRWTYTDIDPIYIPTENNNNRPEALQDLPVCCNPRPWRDLSLQILVDSNPVPSNPINLGLVDAKLDKMLPLSTPIKVKHDQKIYYNVTNNNNATEAADTWSKLDLVLNGEVINEYQLALEKNIARQQGA